MSWRLARVTKTDSGELANGNAVGVGAASPPTEIVAEALGPDFGDVQLIGRGGMGSVYKAHDKRLDQTVAVKVINNIGDPTALRRLISEAQVLAELQHQHIVRVFRLETCGSSCAMVMEFVEGTDLQTIIGQGKLGAKECREVLGQCAEALREAHKNCVVHRDLKPSNILVTESGGKRTIKIADFGIAKFIDGEEQKLTKTGVIVGSPEYVSPEVCRGEKADARSDIYSLGCVGFAMLAGKPPFDGESAFEVMYQHVSSRIPQVETPDKSLAAIIAKCTEPEPEARFQSVEELIEALKLDASFEHQPALPKHKESRNWVRPAVAALVVMGAIAIGAVTMMPERKAPDTDMDTKIRRFENGLRTQAEKGRRPTPEFIAEIEAFAKQDELKKKDFPRYVDFHKAIADCYYMAAEKNNGDGRMIDLAIKHYTHALDMRADTDISMFQETQALGAIAYGFRRPQDLPIITSYIRRQVEQTRRIKDRRHEILITLHLLAVAYTQPDDSIRRKLLAELRGRGVSDEEIRYMIYFWGMQARKGEGGVVDQLIERVIEDYPNFPFDRSTAPRKPE
jgi:hypothetical protein